ncbi:Wzz/FepE/Etk N-terminal domain-containing protein [Simiduia curdlanivorans]|uniref:Wzz/FepE/Etk N-terminal domain-containing protein n=1 Tax=Simiduia curdlanivorans TaxID=1492769 RepID=A0ABV8V3V9_9GAMM|nr:Wzz/FepE/Etk N-terminal domain-containing protein [Simiduia curdlanivorans]MDN3639994.1 Wzz/FepE/Etk N-terminal domain-containing protein [Simiduia curdlanivorans]
MTDPKNNQTPQPPAVQYLTGHYPAVRDDEIDLKELILGLWAEKWLIVAITSVFTLAALVYALTATPYYKTEAKIRPAPKAHFLEINNTGVINITSASAFDRLFSALESRTNKREFFLANKELFAVYYKDNNDQKAFASFLRDGFIFTVPDEKKDKGKGVFLSIGYVSPEGVDAERVLSEYYRFSEAKVLNAYTNEYQMAIKAQVADVHKNIAQSVEALEISVSVETAKLKEADKVQIAELQDRKSSILAELKQLRLSRLKVLEEAKSTAQKLGIETPRTISNFDSKAREATATGGVVTTIDNRDAPLYLMGTMALTAEIETLKSRTDEAIADSRIAAIDRELAELAENRKVQALQARLGNPNFYRGVSDLKEKLFRLESLPDELQEVDFALVVDSPYTDSTKVKPRRSLICIVGLIIGGMLGLFVALIKRIFVK